MPPVTAPKPPAKTPPAHPAKVGKVAPTPAPAPKPPTPPAAPVSQKGTGAPIATKEAMTGKPEGEAKKARRTPEQIEADKAAKAEAKQTALVVKNTEALTPLRANAISAIDNSAHVSSKLKPAERAEKDSLVGKAKQINLGLLEGVIELANVYTELKEKNLWREHEGDTKQAAWEAFCTSEIGFTPQYVNGWIRVAQHVEYMKSVIEEKKATLIDKFPEYQDKDAALKVSEDLGFNIADLPVKERIWRELGYAAGGRELERKDPETFKTNMAKIWGEVVKKYPKPSDRKWDVIAGVAEGLGIARTADSGGGRAKSVRESAIAPKMESKFDAEIDAGNEKAYTDKYIVPQDAWKGAQVARFKGELFLLVDDSESSGVVSVFKVGEIESLGNVTNRGRALEVVADFCRANLGDMFDEGETSAEGEAVPAADGEAEGSVPETTADVSEDATDAGEEIPEEGGEDAEGDGIKLRVEGDKFYDQYNREWSHNDIQTVAVDELSDDGWFLVDNE